MDFGGFGAPGAGDPAPWSAQGRVKAAVELRHSAIGLVREGRWAEAAATVADSVAQLRAIAVTDPQAADQELGKSLASLAGYQTTEGRTAKCLELAMEAAPLLRHGVAADPAGYLAALTLDLYLMADACRQLKRYGEATDAVAEALACVRRPDFRADPGVAVVMQSPELADNVGELLGYQCQMILFAVYTARNEPVEALATAHEALGAAHLLASRAPRRFTVALARHLSTLAELYTKRRDVQIALGYRHEALPLWEAAVGYSRADLGHDFGNGARVRVVQSLRGYAMQLVTVSRPLEAFAPAREATEHARTLARSDPVRYQALFERCQKTLAALEQRGRRK
jgi:tetratricopeptide (TPR) repeat protein